MKKITRQTMVDYVKREAERGSIYVWGGQGERGASLTAGWIGRMETSAANTKRAVALLNRNRAAYDAAMIGAFDCSGLIGACLNANGNPGYDTTAEGYRQKCVPISREHMQPGDFVFEWNGKKSGHIGVYIGGGRVIEARGRDYGVVETGLDARGWKRYGRPDFIYEGQADAPVLTPTGDPYYWEVAVGVLNFREAPNGRILKQMRRGDIVYLDRYVNTEKWARVKDGGPGGRLGYVWLAYIAER